MAELQGSDIFQSGLWGEIESEPISRVKNSIISEDKNQPEYLSTVGSHIDDKETEDVVDIQDVTMEEDDSTTKSQTLIQTPVQRMMDFLAYTDAHFKHQQREEPDLSHQEKVKIATELFENKPSVFLARFAKYIRQVDLSCFDHLVGDYVIDFHLKDIRQMLDDRKTKTKIRNRRFEAVKKMQSQGSYFSDEEMKERDPYLYEQMVGQYLTEDEVAAEIDKTDLSFSNILLKHIQVQQNNERYQQLREEENIQEEEEDNDDDDFPKEDESKEENIEEADRLVLRDEFTQIMKQRFLNGEDKDFDYSKVDDEAEYDCLDIRAADEEDHYFDDEGSETAASMSSYDSAKNLCKAVEEEETEDYMSYEPEYEGQCGNEAEALVSESVRSLHIDNNTDQKTCNSFSENILDNFAQDS